VVGGALIECIYEFTLDTPLTGTVNAAFTVTPNENKDVNYGIYLYGAGHALLASNAETIGMSGGVENPVSIQASATAIVYIAVRCANSGGAGFKSLGMDNIVVTEA
jgi:hypothetical protein